MARVWGTGSEGAARVAALCAWEPGRPAGRRSGRLGAAKVSVEAVSTQLGSRETGGAEERPSWGGAGLGRRGGVAAGWGRSEASRRCSSSGGARASW